MPTDNPDIGAVREILRGKTIHITPYMHADWAWHHRRVWHEARYAASIADSLDLTEQYPEYRFEDMVSIADKSDFWTELQNQALAYRLPPLQTRPVRHLPESRPLPLSGSLLSVDALNMQISAAFLDGPDLLVRLWESSGRQTDCCLQLPVPLTAVTAENFIGEPDPQVPIELHNDQVRVRVRAWAMVTLRCRPADADVGLTAERHPTRAADRPASGCC